MYVAIDTGLLKPNISAWVGNLYGSNDPRRDSGFSIFYMGINIGAVMAPLVCGYLAQSEGFRTRPRSAGFNPATSWHWGLLWCRSGNDSWTHRLRLAA
ncbi:MAG: hypothetical protein H0T95_09220 [Chthoniobacterales bacterium]|nr:hypothetical protein [Chthoniobacterales bacterium]